MAGYIFGKNRGERKIAMTAPVTQTEGKKIAMTAPVTQAASGEDGARWRIQFMMPAEYSLEALPEPLDPAIRFRVEGRAYVFTFFSNAQEVVRAIDAEFVPVDLQILHFLLREPVSCLTLTAVLQCPSP